MRKQIHAHAKVLEIGSMLSTILSIYNKDKPNVDSILKECLDKLQKEHAILQSAVGVRRKGSFTKEMKEVDKEIAKYFVGLKLMVKGYMHHPDKEIANNASIVWYVISRAGRNIHKRGYLIKINELEHLADRLMGEEISDIRRDLLGIEEYLLAIVKFCEKLRDLVRNSTIESIEREKRIQPTAQAKKIHKIMNNEFLPYLYTMRMVDPKNHNKLAKLVDVEVKEINTKIRARRTRWVNRAKDNPNDEANV